jgi:hypothetical protein
MSQDLRICSRSAPLVSRTGPRHEQGDRLPCARHHQPASSVRSLIRASPPTDSKAKISTAGTAHNKADRRTHKWRFGCDRLHSRVNLFAVRVSRLRIVIGSATANGRNWRATSNMGTYSQALGGDSSALRISVWMSSSGTG